MCGIAGFLRSCVPGGCEKALQRMGETIAHRGPDASGEYYDDLVGLSHRRLSIIDLSPLGNQPMMSADGRYVIVYNGEIYNYLDLRDSLARHDYEFKSRTDTEVILALYARYGSECLSMLNGMFAFAIWDKAERRLFLARDRIGKKPLYYFHGGGDRIAFASEIKSLLKLRGIPREIDPTAMADYLKYLYIPAPKTIFKNIHKLPPAHFLEVEVGGSPNLVEYWDLDFSRTTTCSSEESAAEELLWLIEESTANRMIADVPLGAFLSGGIDSSAIVAMMARVSGERIKTCSIGFSDRRHDETSFARQIAEWFDTEHYEYEVGSNPAETVNHLFKYFDEPFADSSAVPTFHVSRLARRSVTVALAGDGGDETFGGYEKYSTDLYENLARQYLPKPMLKEICRLTSDHRSTLLRKAHTLTTGALLDAGRSFYETNSFIGDGALAEILSEKMLRDCNGYDPAEHTLKYWDRARGADIVSRMLYTDIKTYLPGDILVKVDRMSMAHSLEVRAPLLDWRVMEFAASLPSNWKLKRGRTKQILKKAFASTLPHDVLNRRKHGFTVPLDNWLRKDLCRLAYDMLFRNPELEIYFSMENVKNLWRQHQAVQANHGTVLWSLLCFALWHREYMRV